MKTTLEIPDAVFRRAKATAAARGQALKDYVTEALQEKLSGRSQRETAPWMKGFGRLRALHAETTRIQTAIDAEFGVIEPEDRA
jgi:hypothetical protein